MKKQPRAAFTPNPQKRPAIASDPSHYHRVTPSWRIGRMEMAEPFGWNVIGGDKLRDIQGKLRSFESMTWGELLNGTQHHLVPVNRLSNKAQERLGALRQDDLESMLSMRLSGKERVWGILAEGVCTLIWWDPEHEICPAPLKHT